MARTWVPMQCKCAATRVVQPPAPSRLDNQRPKTRDKRNKNKWMRMISIAHLRLKKKTEYYTKTILITMNIHSNFPYFLSFRCLPHLIAHEKKTVFQNIKIKRKMNWTDETLKLWLYCYVCFCCAFLRSSHFSIFIVFLSECDAKRMGQSFGECLAFRHNANAHSLIQ